MNNVWLGDFRCKQLRYWQEVLDKKEKAKQKKAKKAEKSENDEEENIENTIQNENIFVTDDTADISWFETVAKAEVAAISNNTNIIFNLGFNDCLVSCTWKSLDINTIVTNYIKVLKEMTKQNNNLKFYFCSVNPVDASCPGISYKGELIQLDALNKKIETFNNLIKEKCLDDGTSFYFDSDKKKDKKDQDKCNVVFIDSYNYFKSTSFNGRDGKYYSHETCLYMLDFVKSYIRIVSGTSISIIQRTEAPTKTDTYYFDDNVYYQNGWGMPNCTCYAWGRFYEILGEKPKLFTAGDAEMVFGGGVCLDDNEEAAKKGTAKDGYERGQTPQVGAVMCWENTSTSRGSGGHVAIVEEVISPTEVKTSESEHGGRFWVSLNRKKGSDGNWGMSYRFQGFIYNPKVVGGGTMAAVGDYITDGQVVAKNTILSEDEMKINARYIWQYLGSRGWTLNAVAGMLGNMQSESTISPNRYEISSSAPLGEDPTIEEIKEYFYKYKAANSYFSSPDSTGSYGRFPGIGLTGWTFAHHSNPSARTDWRQNKLIQFCDDNGYDFRKMDGNLECLLWECENGYQWMGKSQYGITFKQFSTSTKDVRWLAECFLDNFENPANPDYKTRGDQAEKWYEYLLPFSPFMAAPMSLVNLKIDEYEPTKIKGSFVVRNGEIGSCKLFKGKSKTNVSSKKYIKKDLTGINDKEKEKKTASGDSTKVIKFEFSKLIPNTEYRILVEVSKEDKLETIKSEITFKTPQDRPGTVSDIVLLANDSKFPNESFKLTCKANVDWGTYWKKNSYGYTIQLLVNGKCLKEKNISKLSNSTTFNLNKYFADTELKLGNIIQIGIRTWVTDDKGKKVFDNSVANVSNSICMLKQPFVTYLNVD